MGEIASVFQTSQIGIESVEGTATAANRLLQSLSFTPKPEAEVQMFGPEGQKFDTIATPGREWATHAVGGVATYTELVYLFAMLMKHTTPAAAGTTGKLWTFDMSHNSEDVVDTITLQRGDATRAQRYTGLRVSGAAFDVSRAAIGLQGNGISRALEDNFGTLTASPTTVALVPVLPKHFNFYIASSYAGLAGATPLNRGFKLNWALGNRFGPVWPVQRALASYGATVEMKPTLQVRLTVAADTEGMALLTNMRAGSTVFVRAQAQGDLIEAGHNYLFQIDTACKVTAPSELRDHEGVMATEWTMNAVRDATWGKTTEVQLKNTIATL